MIKITVPIKGMHCRSCEILIADKLKEIPEVNNVRASFAKKNAEIYLKKQVPKRLVIEKIEAAGYEVGVEKLDWFSNKYSDYRDLVYSALILAVLYFLLKRFGIFNLNVGGGNNSSLLVVLLVGLTAGISTCMALVGGLVLGISARHKEKHPEATPAQNFRPHLFFNLGRIVSYTVLGGLIGLIGKGFQLSGPTLGAMIIIVAFVMLLLGIQLTNISPKLSAYKLTLPPALAKLFGIKEKHNKEYSHTNSALVGALTFFLPCGFTQAMQLYAISTGSFARGAAIMGIFALGTAPGLLGIGGLASVVKGAFAQKFFRFTGILVIALAVFNFSNGYNLTGWRFFSGSSANTSSVSDPNVKIVNGVQEVRMTQGSTGYKPNKFIIQKDIPVKWIINSTDPSSCAASIFSSKIGVRKLLKGGENIIQFTPKEVGDISFTCSMGMYRGKFTVIENQSTASQPTQSQSSPTITPTPTTSLSPSATPSPSRSKVTFSTRTPSSTATPNYSNQTKSDEIQTIKATFKSVREDISPADFTVEAGKKVRFIVSALEDGIGCMSTILIPGLFEEPLLITKDEPVVMEFIPYLKETYQITCAMGVPRGTLTVV